MTTDNSATQPLVQPPHQFTPPKQGEVIICNNINYYIGNQIGQGAFGAVFECTDDWSNRLVAKVVLPQNRSYEQVREEWLHEFQNLVQLRHPNITFIHQAFEYRDTFYLVVERCDMMLEQLITGPGMKGDIWLPYVARDILHALDYIHNHGYVHKDLHPRNIFVSHHYDFMVPTKPPVWSFKIGDLGISRLEGDIRLFNTILAKWMLPPEFLNPQDFGIMGKHIDIYHTGLLLLDLLSNQINHFTEDEILDGKPRQTAERINSPYAPAVAKALRRHVRLRTQSAIEFWRDIFQAMPKLT